MSFEIKDHSLNRISSFVINDWIDKSAGDAIRVAGDIFDVPSQKSNAVANQVTLALTSALAGLSGKRFESRAACRAFFLGEVSMELGQYVQQHYQNLKPHFASPDNWKGFTNRVSKEFVALVDALLPKG